MISKCLLSNKFWRNIFVFSVSNGGKPLLEKKRIRIYIHNSIISKLCTYSTRTLLCIIIALKGIFGKMINNQKHGQLGKWNPKLQFINKYVHLYVCIYVCKSTCGDNKCNNRRLTDKCNWQVCLPTFHV